MRILYGSGNFIGSNIAAGRFVLNAPGHDIQVAAHYRNHRYLKHIHWCLDALYTTKVGDKNYFKENYGRPGPYINHALADLIINDLLEWQPELVISDCEYFTAMVAKAFGIPLWYCSPLLQITGIVHEKGEISSKRFNQLKWYLESLPDGDNYLIYSPLGDIKNRPLLKPGFQWIRPYSSMPKEITSEDVDLSLIQKLLPGKSNICTGEMSFISDCLYTGKPLYISPNPLELEQVMNAQLLEWYGVAKNIGRPQSLDFAKRQVERPNPVPILSIQNWKQLDEQLE